MNSSGYSRHMACRLCRERKVRCDGELPTCGRCARSGENCIYVPTSNPTKADLIETVETVQDRLNKAEASLAAMQNRERARNMRQMSDPLFHNITDPMALPQCFDDSISTDAQKCFDWTTAPTMQYSLETTQHLGSPGKRMSGAPVFTFPFGKEKPQPSDLAHTSTSSGDGSSLANGNARSSNSSRDSLPSLMDVRRWIATPVQAPAEINSAADAAVLASFKEFMLSSLTSQAKIAGVAAAMADYISWTRRRDQNDLAIADVLEMFEARAREIAGIAEIDSQKAYQHVETTVGQLPSHEQIWRALDVDIAQRKGRLSMFFDKSYDIYTPLADQR